VQTHFSVLNNSKSNLNKLQRVVVLKRHPLMSSNGCFQNSTDYPTHHRSNFKLATLTFKALSSHQPSYLSSLRHIFSSGSAVTPRSSSHHLLAIRNEFGKHAVSFSAPYVWNSILIEIRFSPSLPSFKRRLKSNLHPSTRHSSSYVLPRISLALAACTL